MQSETKRACGSWEVIFMRALVNQKLSPRSDLRLIDSAVYIRGKRRTRVLMANLIHGGEREREERRESGDDCVRARTRARDNSRVGPYAATD